MERVRATVMRATAVMATVLAAKVVRVAGQVGIGMCSRP